MQIRVYIDPNGDVTISDLPAALLPLVHALECAAQPEGQPQWDGELLTADNEHLASRTPNGIHAGIRLEDRS